MEMGYKASKEQFDPKCLANGDSAMMRISRVIDGIESEMKLSCMVDIGRVRVKISSRDQSPSA